MVHRLDDATFTIPLRIDSADRLANVLAVAGALRREYSSRIIVGTEGAERVRPLLPRGVEVLDVEPEPVLPFHHTRVLNELARAAETPVLINNEADVLIPPAQLVEAVRMVVDGEADLVLPYDHGVGVAPGERLTLTGRPVTAADAVHRARFHWKVIGGCVVWRASSFTAFGMENEHFVSWGLEDDERLVRVEALGGRIARVAGPLLHLDHHRGPDSNADTIYHASNSQELARIRSMSPRALRAEVAGWPWLHGSTSRRRARLELDDLTITIPFRLDSRDRLRNLGVVTRALEAHTTARVLVGAGCPEDLAGVVSPGTEVVEVPDPPGQPFHRTRILNRLAATAATPLLGNHDADVVVPLDQLAAAVASLRAGEADLVLPYGGRMVDVPLSAHPWLERADYESMPPAGVGLLHPQSVGGCVLWRAISFRAAGTENERFRSWGLEDVERIERATRLGLTVRRVEGVVYHLRHSRGPDSDETNRWFAANEEELARMSALEPERLREEVGRWPWLTEAESFG
jgi:hypothetical protein